MPFLIANWRLIAVAVVVGVLAIYAGLMRVERDAVRAEYADYRTKVAQAAAAAAQAALQRTIADEKRKEAADAENAHALATLAGTIKRLRDDARTSGGSVSASPAGSRCPPEQVCFDRAEYQRADGKFVAGARGLADEGSKVTVDLDTAAEWAQGKEM